MEDEILVNLTKEEWNISLRSLERFKGSVKYLGYTQKKKDDFDKLIKKIKGRLERLEEE